MPPAAAGASTRGACPDSAAPLHPVNFNFNFTGAAAGSATSSWRDLMCLSPRRQYSLPPSRASTDLAGRVTRQHLANAAAETWTSQVANHYGSGTGYALGAIVSSTSSDSKNGTYQSTSTTTNTIGWRDGAVTTRTTHEKTRPGGAAAYCGCSWMGRNRKSQAAPTAEPVQNG